MSTLDKDTNQKGESELRMLFFNNHRDTRTHPFTHTNTDSQRYDKVKEMKYKYCKNDNESHFHVHKTI